MTVVCLTRFVGSEAVETTRQHLWVLACSGGPRLILEGPICSADLWLISFSQRTEQAIIREQASFVLEHGNKSNKFISGAYDKSSAKLLRRGFEFVASKFECEC